MTKPNKEAEAKTDAEKEDELVGFTPEEEAALDAAAKGEAAAATPIETKVETEEVKPDEEIARLTKELNAANSRAEDERKKREDVEKRNVTSVDDLEGSEQTRIKQADEKIKVDIELADAKVSELRRQLREAKEAGELDKEDEINDKLLDAKIEQKRLTGAKDGFEKWKGERPDFWNNERKKAEKAAAVDPDAFVPEAYTPKALEWINKNPQFKTDKKFRSRSVAAHYEAEAEGIAVDTPEYFAFINKKLGTGDAAVSDDDAAAEAAAVSEAGKTTVAAKKPATKVQTLPPSRTGGTTQRTEGTRIKKLTAAEREAAEISGMTYEEYWDDKYGNQSN